MSDSRENVEIAPEAVRSPFVGLWRRSNGYPGILQHFFQNAEVHFFRAGIKPLPRRSCIVAVCCVPRRADWRSEATLPCTPCFASSKRVEVWEEGLEDICYTRGRCSRELHLQTSELNHEPFFMEENRKHEAIKNVSWNTWKEEFWLLAFDAV